MGQGIYSSVGFSELLLRGRGAESDECGQVVDAQQGACYGAVVEDQKAVMVVAVKTKLGMLFTRTSSLPTVPSAPVMVQLVEA